MSASISVPKKSKELSDKKIEEMLKTLKHPETEQDLQEMREYQTMSPDERDKHDKQIEEGLISGGLQADMVRFLFRYWKDNGLCPRVELRHVLLWHTRNELELYKMRKRTKVDDSKLV